MSNALKLSICMMVKNEEKNLVRCLDAMSPLLGKPDVELIIVDTGSTDNTVEIASRYTSKLYLHNWQGDFSAMRNITISYARGEFILIIDADEVILAAEQLYNVIAEAGADGFNTLTLKVKSLTGVKGVYTVLTQERVFRNDGGFRYEGSVHNQPIYNDPILNTDIYVEHYGYIFTDPELKERKFQRTCTLLKAELEKNPDSMYYRFQIARSYDAHGDYQDALREIRIAYSLIQNSKMKKIFVLATYALICSKNREYEEAITICKDGLELVNDYLDLHYVLAESCSLLGRHQEAFEAYLSYIELYEKYDDLPISNDRSIEMYCRNDAFKNKALAYIINELLRQGKYNNAKIYALKFEDKSAMNNFLFSIYLNCKEFKELQELFYEHLNDKEAKLKFSLLIENERLKLNAENKSELERLFSKEDDAYSQLNRIRLAKEDNKDVLINRIFKEVNLNELPDFYADMFLDTEKRSKLVFSCLRRLQKSTIKAYVNRLIDKSTEFRNVFEAYSLRENVRENDYDSLRLFTAISYVLLFKAASKADRDVENIPEQYTSIFDRYVRYGLNYTSILYNHERLRLYYHTLDDMEDRFIIALGYAGDAVDKSDYSSAIRYFTEALNANKYMACYLNHYKDVLFKGLGISHVRGEKNE
jgi:glycosyltransferase involved in cell wall biosynthesis